MTNRSRFDIPRSIKPSLVQVGDTIKITLPKKRGIESTVTGTVHHRSDHGKTRFLYTEEGATILSWEPGNDSSAHIMLLHRAEIEHPVLDFFNTELPEGLAG